MKVVYARITETESGCTTVPSQSLVSMKYKLWDPSSCRRTMAAVTSSFFFLRRHEPNKVCIWIKYKKDKRHILGMESNKTPFLSEWHWSEALYTRQNVSNQ